MEETKLGFVLRPGTKWATAWAAAPAALAGFQAASAQRQLGKVRTNMDAYIKGRQAIENPFANMSNPYENLAVATQAAEIKMEQTDQALANTLDTLRETGAAAGGATAIARAALESKKGIAASIETQEVNNQKLQAQGQLKVDIAKGKGEAIRMEAQELRDTNELNRLQNQSDMAQYRRDTSIQSGLGALGDAAGVRNAGIVPEQKDQKDAANTPYTEEELELLRIGNSDSDPSKPLSIAASKQNATGVSLNPLLGEDGLPILNRPDATNLSQFYGAGKLPSPADRAPLYEQAGLGTAGSYEASRPQNDKLLEYLQTADLTALGIN